MYDNFRETDLVSDESEVNETEISKSTDRCSCHLWKIPEPSPDGKYAQQLITKALLRTLAICFE